MIKLRIPCKEQFAFIEEDYEGNDVKGRYDELYSLMNDKTKPISITEYLINLFNEDLDKQMWGKMSPDQYEALPQSEKDLVQAIKRFYKRIDNASKELETKYTK